jgi:anti-anti-sigma factor
MYLSCPTCNLQVFRRPDDLGALRCPRCGARATVTLRDNGNPRQAALDLDPFACEVVRQGTTTTLRITGEVDIARQHRLHAAGATAAKDCECLVVDLTATSFLSSSGVRALVEIRQATDARGARLVTLVRRGGAPAHVIALCGLDDHLGLVHEPQIAAVVGGR